MMALTMVAILFAANAFAQPDNYVEATEATYHTAGKDVRLYVKPDPVYSPGWVINANSRWTFTYPAALNGIAVPANGVASTNNYLTITAPPAGTYVINYVETNSTFTCDDGGLSHTLIVLPVPTAEITISAGAGWTQTIANKSYYRCGDDTDGETVTVTFTETGVRASDARYAFRVQRRVVNIDASGNDILGTETTTDVADYQTGLNAKYHTNTADGGSWSYNQTTLPVINNARTKYEFILYKATGVPGAEGVVSAISQKSDYDFIAGAMGTIVSHPFTGLTTVTYIVNPTPVTGPIYHIPNQFAY